jgi:hypothetical protein
MPRLDLRPRIAPHTSWPEEPATRQRVPALFSERPAHRRMLVVRDEDAWTRIDPFAAELLSLLIDHPFVEVWHYAEDGPPEEIRDTSEDETVVAAPYWLTVFQSTGEGAHNNGLPGLSFLYELEREGSPGLAGSYLDVDRLSSVLATAAPAGEFQTARTRARTDLLALAAADALSADLLMTDRPTVLASRSHGQGVTVATADEAIALVSLYLRSQGVYLLGSLAGARMMVAERSGFFFIGSRALLSTAEQWDPASIDQISLRSRVFALRNSMLQRFDRALRNRDRIHLAMSQPFNSSTADAAMEALDSTLVFLMASCDALARAAHVLLGLPDNQAHNAGWQRPSWTSRPEIQSIPTLATLLADDSAERACLTILSRLRNTIHAVAMARLRHTASGGNTYLSVIVPEDYNLTELRTSFTTAGGEHDWGVSQMHDGRMRIEPADFIERLFATLVPLLNALAGALPIAPLPPVSEGEDRERGFSSRDAASVRTQLAVG